VPEPPDVEVYREALAARVAGGLDVFAARLRRQHHTAKRARTDSALFGGIGNAYSDELLRRARESPLALTWRMGDATVSALHAAARSVPSEWTQRRRREAAGAFPAQARRGAGTLREEAQRRRGTGSAFSAPRSVPVQPALVAAAVAARRQQPRNQSRCRPVIRPQARGPHAEPML